MVRYVDECVPQHLGYLGVLATPKRIVTAADVVIEVASGVGRNLLDVFVTAVTGSR